ncbi:MAG: response regulator transcription factor [Anaerolineales bacterium]
MSDTNVMLVDDHAVLRAGLCALLEEQDEIVVVGQADSADEAIEQMPELAPDIVVMDLGMPGLNAFDAIRQLRTDYPELGIIVLSMHKGNEIVTRALESGADGYVPKSSAHTDLLRAIRSVRSGKAYLHPSATTALVDAMHNVGDAQILLGTLSDREREVLRWTARGFSSREIGEKLSISGKTVDTYRQRLMQKLSLTHRSEMVDLALRAGMLGDPSLDG